MLKLLKVDKFFGGLHAVDNVSIKIKKEWISQEISYCNINAPSGTRLRTQFKFDKCLILNRTIFDYDLSLMAQREGCDIFTKTIVKECFFQGERREIVDQAAIETLTILLAEIKK